MGFLIQLWEPQSTREREPILGCYLIFWKGELCDIVPAIRAIWPTGKSHRAPLGKCSLPVVTPIYRPVFHSGQRLERGLLVLGTGLHL